MENNTNSTKLNEWQVCCHSSKIASSGFYRIYTFKKKFFLYVSLLLLVLGFTPNSYGQDVGSSTVKGNFGIDGDVYANRLQFLNVEVPPVAFPVPAAGTDDWFLNSTLWSGSGKGVIDQLGLNPASDPIPNPMTNTPFELRQSIFAPAAPFPYPVVPLAGYDPGNPATWSGRYLWLDAVYGRDTYVKGGNAETSYFAGSGDKNSDNPNTWSIGTAGSVPQKDDIIDVYAHIRGEGIRIPFSDVNGLDPRPFTTLWAYAGASLVVTNGNKHLDFEFFRTGAELVGNAIVNTGSDGGRTAWTFNPDGSIAIPGTIIISIDYINGGNVPSIRIRVWMSQATFDAYDNTKGARPFNVDKNVAFEKGTDSGDYGYAAINPKVDEIDMWGRVNDDFATYENSRTLGPPWETWEGTTPTAVDMYTRYQFVEIGINLTALGLDTRGSQDLCSNLLGSLLVKTRSSGGGPNEGAFGSELKDFAGPYLFGFTGAPPVITVAPKTICESDNPVNLTTGTSVSEGGGAIEYFTDDDYEVGDKINDPTMYNAPLGETTIYVRSEKLGNPGCFGFNSFTVTVNDQPNAGTDGSTTVCESSTTPIDLFSLITGEDAGGTWTRLTGTGGTFNAATGTYTPALNATTSTFRYSLSATAPCIADESIATVNINNQPNAGADGNTTVCESSTTPIDLFSLITGEDAGGTWTRLTGTGGTFNAAAGTYTPALDVTTSTFRYSLSATAPCIADESIATVNINNQPNAGADGNTTVCESSTTPIDLFSLITGEDAGGTWTRLTGTGGTFNAAAGTYTPALDVTTSTFRYSLSATAPCIADESIATVNINNQPNAGADGNTTVCESSTTPIDLFSLITGEDAGGTWTRLTGTGGTFNAAAGTYTPALDATTSTFRYSLSATAPCIADESIATVNINNQPNAGADGNTTVCESSTTPIDLFSLITGEDEGGTWTRLTGTGGTFNAAAGTYTPVLNATTSTFRYSLSATAPCIADESIATVNINNQPNAGADGNTTVCESSTTPIDLFSLITGEDAGGTWTRLTGTGGTFNAAAGTYTPALDATTSTFRYSLSATAPCIADESIATVNINNQPNAGADGNTTVCESSTTPIDLFSLITGEDAGGTWTRLTGTGGTFNAATGTYTPALNATTSTFRYSLSATAPCIADESIATVNINNQPNAGADGNTTVCESSTTPIDLFSLITGEDAGGTWTRLTGTGGTFNAATGTYTPALNATTSTFRYSLSATAPCVGDESVATVTINPNPTCEITGEQTICAGASSKFTATAGMSSYAWTGPGGFTASTQEITVSAAGVYEVTITDANGCQSTCSRELMLVACGGPLCTYTQGYYGNVGGMSCAPDPENPGEFKQYTTKALIARALEAYGGTMYVGIKDVRHVSIMNTMTDIDAVIAVLPGGGMSKALPTGPNNGLHSISSLPQSLLKDGRINNTLLAQTIVLGLNLGINSNLGNFELQAGTFATADSEGGCGSDTPKARSCNPDGTVNNEYEFYSIPANIVTALGGNATVQGLYALANQALGGGDTNGVSLSAIADVVDKINNAFDECRIPMGYGIEPLDCPVLETITTQSLMETSLAGFVAYPVPVDGPLTVQCTFDYTSDVVIEVFDSQNQMVYTKSQAQCTYGTIITLDYNFNSEQQQVFYVRLTTSQGSTTHDVISAAK